jgi:hypothetical protein
MIAEVEAKLAALPNSKETTPIPVNPETLKAMKVACEKATPGPWSVWDSCSWRRIGTTQPYADGNVICPITQSDGHPDLLAKREDLDFIAICNPANVSALIAEVERQAQEIQDLNQELIKSTGCALVDCPMRRN